MSEATKPNSSDRAKPKAKGWISKTEFVESVFVNGKPAFLIIDTDTGKFSVKSRISTPNGPIRPLRKGEMGYMPYEFTIEEIEKLNESEISLEEILEEIEEQVRIYFASPVRDRILMTGDLLLTYCQEWISTVHYPYFVGEYGSGKTTGLLLCGVIGYRCLITGSMTYAGIFNSLGSDEEGAGTIAEDEAQTMDNDKIRLYTDSYSKGKTVPRVRGAGFTQMVYYKAFCCKWFSGTRTPDDGGLRERLAVVHMLGGKSEKNIKDVYSNMELRRPLQTLRNKMLYWKMKNIERGFPKIDSGLTGRDHELWNDFLSIFSGTKFEEDAKKTVQYYLEQRHEAINDRVEPKILTIIKPMLEESLEIELLKIWDAIIESDELPGDLDSTKRTFHTHFGDTKITLNSLSHILIEKFHAKKRSKYETRDGKRKKVTYYVFDKEVIRILSEKYHIEDPL